MEEGRSIAWRLPVYNTIHHILHNPIYAGSYAFGRTGSRVTIEAGRKRIVRGFRRERQDWEVLLLDHHEGYLYPVHIRTRKSFGLMTRKLSVTESLKLPQFLGTLSRKKSSVASANCPHVA